MMRGQAILARTMNVPTARAKDERPWQYHSRSDAHSKVACWTLLFDTLLECDVLKSHAERGLLGFGINFEMVGPISKTLDLVFTRVSPNRATRKRRTFSDLAEQLGLVLDNEDRRLLAGLPTIEHDDQQDSSEVVLALEAKACMTKHSGSLPRLHAEILATGYLAKRAMPRCIVVSYTLVNSARTFLSPGSSGKPNKHKQPEDAQRVIDMLANAIPLARDTHNLVGYDVVGATAIECANDGSDVVVDESLKWPERSEHVRYKRMISALCSEYRARAGY